MNVETIAKTQNRAYNQAVNLGELIKSERLKRSMSQEKLGELAGVSGGVISRIERGESQGRSKTIAKLTAILGIDPGRVQAALGGEGRIETVRPRKKRLDLLEELRELMEEDENVVWVPVADQIASAGPGGAAEPENWPHRPRGDERGHEFVFVYVRGDCMEPDIPQGAAVLVDKTARIWNYDIVVAVHEGESVVRIYEEAGSGAFRLVAKNDGERHPPIYPNDTTRIIGVVKELRLRIHGRPR